MGDITNRVLTQRRLTNPRGENPLKMEFFEHWGEYWKKGINELSFEKASTTVVLTEKAIAFCNDKTETWLDVAFANKTKPKYESTEQLVAKGLFPGAVALPEPSRASQSPAAFE